MQALLARGASVAATNGAQMTPLLVAAFARKTAVVEALLAAGADVIAPLCALSSVLPKKSPPATDCRIRRILLVSMKLTRILPKNS